MQLISSEPYDAPYWDTTRHFNSHREAALTRAARGTGVVITVYDLEIPIGMLCLLRAADGGQRLQWRVKIQ